MKILLNININTSKQLLWGLNEHFYFLKHTWSFYFLTKVFENWMLDSMLPRMHWSRLEFWMVRNYLLILMKEGMKWDYKKLRSCVIKCDLSREDKALHCRVSEARKSNMWEVEEGHFATRTIWRLLDFYRKSLTSVSLNWLLIGRAVLIAGWKRWDAGWNVGIGKKYNIPVHLSPCVNFSDESK